MQIKLHSKNMLDCIHKLYYSFVTGIPLCISSHTNSSRDFFGISLSDGKNNYSISKNLIIANVVILSSTGFIIFFSVIKITPEIQYLRFNHAKIISTQENYTTNYSIIDQLESQVRTYYKQPSENISTDELENMKNPPIDFLLLKLSFMQHWQTNILAMKKSRILYAQIMRDQQTSCLLKL